jgi:4-amino-4-deoxy-L-arabinose transferase-like glycosyltransferase
MLLGLGMRLWRLGALGFSSNEDYLAISVRSVLENLAPLFPSGVMYPRALPLTYLSSLLVKIFGFSEFTLRLPSVLFSAASIPLVYLLGRRLVSPAAGLLAALLLAVSDLDIASAQSARMYSMFSFFVLLSLVLFHDSAVSKRRYAGTSTVLAILLACLVHRLGVVLVPVFACFALYLHRRGLRPHFAVVCIVAAGLGYAVNSQFEMYNYGHWLGIVEASAIGPLATANGSGFERTTLLLGERVLPLFVSVATGHPYLIAILSALLAIAVISSLALFISRKDSRVFSLAVLAVALALYLQQIMLAICFVAAYALLGRALETTAFQRRSLILLAATAAGFLFWTGFALVSAPPSLEAISEPGTAGTAVAAIKSQLFYPRNFGRVFVAKYPWMSVFTVISLGLAASGYLRDARIEGKRLAAMLFAVPIVLLGAHPWALFRFYERYVHFLLPLFLLLAAMALVAAAEGLAAALRERGFGSRSRRIAVAAFVVLVALLTQLGGAWRSWANITAGYGVNSAVFDRWSGMHPLNPDHKGASQFVKEGYRQGDIVVAMDILAHYAYFPRADYQLTPVPKGDAEGWIGAASLASAADLEDVLGSHPGRRVWIIVSGPELRFRAGLPEMDAIMDLIRKRGGEPVYRGRDGMSDVYLLIPRADAAAVPRSSPRRLAIPVRL